MESGQLSVLSNLDIYFDETLLIKQPLPNQCFALTRWDVIKGNITFYNHVDSQDSWIFTNPPKHIEGADYRVGGVGGIDNKIAYQLDENGYEVLNPSLTIKSYHLHETAYRTYINNGKVERVPPPYKLLTPTV